MIRETESNEPVGEVEVNNCVDQGYVDDRSIAGAGHGLPTFQDETTLH